MFDSARGLAVVVCFLSGCAGSGLASTPRTGVDEARDPSVPEWLYESTVRLQTETGFVYCAGAWVSPTQVATAAHCVENAATVHVRSSYPVEVIEMQVQHVDDQADLAVLKAPDGTEHDAFLIMNMRPRVGAGVWMLGHPGGNTETLTLGVVSHARRRKCDDGRCIDFVQVSAPAYRGNSGGPVVDSRGRLLGVCSHVLALDSMSGGMVFHLVALAPASGIPAIM